ncbi:MAG TPA: sulfite exporter TauE/SafE family protein [Pyrinomonadaceae bacterium]|nr:sulfite exporter TauE/SafE family protein [Pyrinomonadaceae bacterium]
MSVWQEIVVVVSAFLAGMINAVAGGGTLLSFPALIWIGRDPVIANATSTVALWPGSFGGLLGFRRELQGSKRWVYWLGVPSILGGALGAYLLLRTPSKTFSAIVPYLILGATLLMAAQEHITRRLRLGASHERPSRLWWAGALLFQFLVGVYGGYFGAGIGILMLAALGLLGLKDIHEMNGLKNLFALFINGIAALYFIISGAVIWVDVLLMAVAAIAGGYFAAGVARRLGRQRVRRLVILIGIAMAVSLFFRR